MEGAAGPGDPDNRQPLPTDGPGGRCAMMHKQATPRAIDPCRRFFLTLSRIALLPAGAPASGGLLGGVQLGDLQAVVREVERVELAMKQAAATAAPTDPAVGTTTSPVNPQYLDESLQAQAEVIRAIVLEDSLYLLHEIWRR